MNWFRRLLLGNGVLPDELRDVLRREGLVFCEEGLRCSVSYRGYRAPGRYSSSAREPTSGAVAISRHRLVVWLSRGELRGMNINIPVTDEWLREVRVSSDRPDRVSFRYDIGRFHDNRRGDIEVWVRTPSAQTLARRLGR